MSPLQETQLAEFMGWLFRDGGAEPPRREYDAVEQRLRLLIDPPDAGPSAVLSRDLLLEAVDLRAIAWNTLCAVPAHGGSWERFWRKLHDLRRAVNRPEHETIRIAYASTFPDGPTKRDEHRVLDEHWNIVTDEASR